VDIDIQKINKRSSNSFNSSVFAEENNNFLDKMMQKKVRVNVDEFNFGNVKAIHPVKDDKGH